MATTSLKLPKGWNETSTYRCYTCKFGPLTCRVRYSCISQRFMVDLVAGFDTVVKELYREYEPDLNVFDDFDREVLLKMTFEVKQVLRGWTK